MEAITSKTRTVFSPLTKRDVGWLQCGFLKLLLMVGNRIGVGLLTPRRLKLLIAFHAYSSARLLPTVCHCLKWSRIQEVERQQSCRLTRANIVASTGFCRMERNGDALVWRRYSQGKVGSRNREQTKQWPPHFDCVTGLYQIFRNLAFQGSSDRVDDYTAQGNFLSLVKLIAEFDPILKVHLKKFGGKGSATNLSNITQNKFIALLADEVCQNLVRAVEEGKYFGFMWDSTPDISHRDQHALVTRHVTRGEVKESFLGFFEWMEKPVNCVWNLGRCKETSTEVQGLQGNLIRQRKCDGGCENRRWEETLWVEWKTSVHSLW